MKLEREGVDRVARLEAAVKWLTLLVVFVLVLQVFVVTLLTLHASKGLHGAMDKPAHYGTKPGNFETSIIHFPTSKGVSEVSEQANKRSGGQERSE